MTTANTTIKPGAYEQLPGKLYPTREDAINHEVLTILDKTELGGSLDYAVMDIADEVIIGNDAEGYCLNPDVDFWAIARDNEYIDPSWRNDS